MSHSANKVKWCLEKTKKELKEGTLHRGLLKIQPDQKTAMEYLAKAEHNLEATFYFYKGGFSDWCSSSLFYTIYHCFLAVLIKFGYESRNQECTFALIQSLIEEGKINFDMNDFKEINSLDRKNEENTLVDLRERYQYSPKTALGNTEYERLLNLSKRILSQTKEIMEQNT